VLAIAAQTRHRKIDRLSSSAQPITSSRAGDGGQPDLPDKWQNHLVAGHRAVCEAAETLAPKIEFYKRDQRDPHFHFR
jgi:hypothetical protein